MMVEHDRAVPMIEQIDQIMDALLDHDLIVSITSCGFLYCGILVEEVRLNRFTT